MTSICADLHCLPCNSCGSPSSCPSNEASPRLGAGVTLAEGQPVRWRTLNLEPTGPCFKSLLWHVLALGLCHRPVYRYLFSPSPAVAEPLDLSSAHGHCKLRILFPSLPYSKVWSCDHVLANGDVGRSGMYNFQEVSLN